MCHNAKGSQKAVHRIGIEFIRSFINLISVLDFGNILGGSQNMLPVLYGSYLFLRKGGLNGQGIKDGSDAVGTAERGTCR